MRGFCSGYTVTLCDQQEKRTFKLNIISCFFKILIIKNIFLTPFLRSNEGQAFTVLLCHEVVEVFLLLESQLIVTGQKRNSTNIKNLSVLRIFGPVLTSSSCTVISCFKRLLRLHSLDHNRKIQFIKPDLFIE